jgi:nicotinamidase/pyrazinamidase
MEFSFKPDGALLVIDMLNDFIKKGGSLMVPGAERIVPKVREVLGEARRAAVPVIYIADAHLPDDSEFEVWPSHALQDEWGGEVIDELAPLKGDFMIRKRRYSAFFATDLDLLLRERGILHLYLAGVLTNICIYATALDASMRGYGVSVFRDGVASLSEETDRFIFSQLTEVLRAELV